ncbi:MAG: hypothetical protein ACE5IB_04700 [Candidatus Geothermarchaeales archaeon]
MAAVLGVVLLVYGITIPLWMQGASPIPIPYPSPEFLDRYWEVIPLVGWILTVAGVVALVASLATFWKGSKGEEATPINIPKHRAKP